MEVLFASRSRKRAKMRVKNLLITALLAFMLLSLSSCTGGLRKPKQEMTSQTFRTGTEGLVMKFIPGGPPSDVYEGDTMDVSIEYTNKGAFDIQGGNIYLSGFDKNYLRFDRDMIGGITAKGKDEFNPEGNIVNTYAFTVSQVNIPNNADIFPQKIKATACYKYRTYAIGKACIDPDPFGVEHEEKVCGVGPPQITGSQGAPVAVSSVEAQTSRNRVQFKVNVANVGGGTVIDNAAPITDCHSRLERTQVDKLDIRAKFSDKDMKCEPSTIRVTGGAGFAICHWEGDLGAEAYETLLNIQLDYGYRNSIAKDVTIHRLPGKHVW